MSTVSPKIAAVGRDGDTVVIHADGAAALRLTSSQALWLIARLAEALAVRS